MKTCNTCQPMTKEQILHELYRMNFIDRMSRTDYDRKRELEAELRKINETTEDSK